MAGSTSTIRRSSNDFTWLSDAYGNDWLARSAEIVEKYHPDIMYFDWWIGQPGLRHQLTKFAAFYYNASLKYGDHVGVINYKDYAMDATLRGARYRARAAGRHSPALLADRYFGEQ